MGYLPPDPPLTVLIRADMEPFISSLYQLQKTFEVQSQYLRAFSRKSAYQQYLDDLYGHRPRDLFMVWNYILLASMIALIVSVMVLVWPT